MHGRFFGGRRVNADYFDGVTNYVSKESDAEAKSRQDEFSAWIENQ
jgi:hypothetical protein